MSPSPDRDRDTVLNSAIVAASIDFPDGKKKRSNSEATEYPRRRATIALCTDLDADCVYREPGIKLDAGDKLIIERLNRIEGLLQSSLVGQHPPFPQSSTSPATSNDTNLGSDDMVNKSSLASLSGRTSVAGMASWANPPTSISTMPKVHTTPALHLLQWPLIRDLVAGPYDPHTLLQLEMAREPLRMTTVAGLDLSNANTYVQSFFERVNVWYACVNPYTWSQYHKRAMAQRFQEGAESCVVLLVLALGCASHYGTISSIPPDREAPGLPYFTAAWNLLPSVMMRNSVLAAQCIILSSAYLFYLVRPLEAWTLLSNASMKLQLLFGNTSRVPAQWKELSVRVYWNALLYESDLLAELDLPHSGIVHFEESVDLPGGFEEDDEEEEDEDPVENPHDSMIHSDSVGNDELWYFLAEIALRRLLNRVSHMIYQKDNTLTLASLGPIVSELDFQLSQWYDSLPRPVQFPLAHTPFSNPVQTVLRLRYYACRTIIYRPYILAVFENEQTSADPLVKECCRRCLEATLRQLEDITSHREGHLPYLWQGALSMVSQTLLIMGATMSPALAALLPPPIRVDGIIAGVMAEVDRYAHLAPSLRLSAEIIRDAERRRQIWIRSSGKRL
ncbi:Zn(II)2Cys6 transcription factor [Aspergillus terreus]|uniref:Zn(II)2Cys6 transcription factor n=1 Tax=Aspergillus terreus TaxID=33178 RepID=A0A5M3Z1X0_ASPTE|nr:hypothetical protein ATETN484_0008001300 [Aspergillus terreus]GFF16465.1 Zn(II)2Cys6 transcription factor [Aspergillus terreus]